MGKSWKEDFDSNDFKEEVHPQTLFLSGKLTAKKFRKEMQRLGYASSFIKEVIEGKESVSDGSET